MVSTVRAVVVRASNPGTPEAEADGSLSWKPAKALKKKITYNPVFFFFFLFSCFWGMSLKYGSLNENDSSIGSYI